MNAIRTNYKRYSFRSRLEARWAAFFDAIGWQWEYEPLDLDGYIPDFSIELRAGPMLLEVKPELTISLLDQYQRKPAACGWEGPILIVGATHWVDGTGTKIGTILSQNAGIDPSDKNWRAWDVAQLVRCPECETHTPMCVNAGWACHACGTCRGKKMQDGALFDYSPAWADAAKATQWRGEQQ